MLASRSFFQIFHVSHIILQFAAMFYAEEAGWGWSFIGLQCEEGSLGIEVSNI